MREELLLEELLNMVKRLELNKVKLTEKLEKEIERYEKFTNGVIGEQAPKLKPAKVDLKTYATYVLSEGTREEKRELLTCFNSTIYLKDRKVYMDN
jgi:hypothetical protein